MTPGPWKIDRFGSLRSITGANGEPVCEMRYWLPGHEAERMADARLIAAAPSLLAILKSIAESDYDPGGEAQHHVLETRAALAALDLLS